MSERLELNAVPLTPIHIGDGTELLPDRYRLNGDWLELFEPAEVLAAMPPVRQKQFADLLGRGNLRGAYEVLRGGVQQEQVRSRIAISGASLAALKAMLVGDTRSGAVQPFIRSGGQPFIPGSSIKGALRTALLSAFAGQSEVTRAVGAVEMRGKHQTLTRVAFRMHRNDTANDPFRFVHVADVPVLEGRTQVDRARIITLKEGPETRGIQMHYERLLSMADGRACSDVALTAVIEVDGEGLRARRAHDAAAAPSLDVEWNALRQAANAFHWSIWQTERRRFFAAARSTLIRMDQLLGQLRKPDGTTVAQTGFSERSQHVLVRLGRFGHFESKSVEGLRQGHVPQRRTGDKHRKPNEWGATRTVVHLPKHANLEEADVPFGWLLLFPKAAQ